MSLGRPQPAIWAVFKTQCISAGLFFHKEARLQRVVCWQAREIYLERTGLFPPRCWLSAKSQAALGSQDTSSPTNPLHFLGPASAQNCELCDWNPAPGKSNVRQKLRAESKFEARQWTKDGYKWEATRIFSKFKCEGSTRWAPGHLLCPLCCGLSHLLLRSHKKVFP